MKFVRKPAIHLFVSYLTNSKHVSEDDFYALLSIRILLMILLVLSLLTKKQ